MVRDVTVCHRRQLDQVTSFIELTIRRREAASHGLGQEVRLCMEPMADNARTLLPFGGPVLEAEFCKQSSAGGVPRGEANRHRQLVAAEPSLCLLIAPAKEREADG